MFSFNVSFDFITSSNGVTLCKLQSVNLSRWVLKKKWMDLHDHALRNLSLAPQKLLPISLSLAWVPRTAQNASIVVLLFHSFLRKETNRQSTGRCLHKLASHWEYRESKANSANAPWAAFPLLCNLKEESLLLDWVMDLHLGRCDCSARSWTKQITNI